MVEIIMTGYSELDFIAMKRDEKLRCCYFCKRTEQDNSTAIAEGEVIHPKIKLKPYVVNVQDSDLTAKFFLCIECYMFFNALSHDRFMPVESFEKKI